MFCPPPTRLESTLTTFVRGAPPAPVVVDRARLAAMIERTRLARPVRPRPSVPCMEEFVDAQERRSLARARMKTCSFLAALITAMFALLGAHHAGYGARMPSWGEVVQELARLGPEPPGPGISCNTSCRDL